MALTPATPVTHNPAAHILFIGNLEIPGFGEQTGVTYEAKTQAEVKVGIDGLAVVNFSAGSLHRKASITVMNGSMGAKNLAIAREAQKALIAAGGRIAANNYRHSDPQKGTTTTAAVAVFLNDPQGSLEKDAGELTYEIMLLNTQETQNTLAVL